MTGVERVKTWRDLPCVMADADMGATVQRQMEALRRRRDLETAFAVAKKQYQTAIEEENEKLAEIFEVLKEGMVEAPVECEVVYDYGAGTVLTRRLDVDEVVEVRTMTEVDRQGTLALEEEAPAKAATITVHSMGEVFEAPAAEEKQGEAEPEEDGPLKGLPLGPVSKETPKAELEAMRALAMGPIDFPARAKSCYFDSSWMCKVAPLTVLAKEASVGPERMAYHMGAHARVAKKKPTRNPFVMTDPEESRYRIAWGYGFEAMQAIDQALGAQALAEGEARAKGASAGMSDEEIAGRGKKAFLKMLAGRLPSPAVVHAMQEKERTNEWCLRVSDVAADAQAEERGALAYVFGHGLEHLDTMGENPHAGAWAKGWTGVDEAFKALGGAVPEIGEKYRDEYVQAAMAMVWDWANGRSSEATEVANNG